MATVLNKRDVALQAASPRVIAVNLGTTVNVNGTVNGTPAATVVTNASTGATHASSTGNVHNVSLTQISGDLDDIADGVSYFRTTSNQVTGAGRAYNALNSSSEYIKSLKSTQMTVVGSNPATGIVMDANGIRMYQSSVLKVNIPVSGSPSFTGDITGGANIDITGGGTFNGSTSDAGSITAILANDSKARANGVRAYAGSTGGNGVYGNADNASGTGYGGYFRRQNGNSGAALIAESSTTAPAISATGDVIISSGDLDVGGESRCNSFRIDQTPTTGMAVATFSGTKPGAANTNKWVQISVNGTAHIFPAWPLN